MTRAKVETQGKNLGSAQRLEAAGLADRLSAIGRECASHLKAPYSSIDHGDLLYDKDGLPQ